MRTDSDIYLVISSIITNITRHIIIAKGCIAPIIPNRMATPFPPLNLKNIGNICPSITASPKVSWRVAKVSLSWGIDVKYARLTAIAPLRASISRTVTPDFQP